MGSPYLKSGETIVLTTNRVRAGAVQYDVMLTTERVFLIDNRNERFEPRIIPLSTILSVQGGKTPAHDPVIVLLFRTAEAGVAREPLNLIFSQNPSENRKPERDNWMKNLIRLSVAWQERTIMNETPAEPTVTRVIGLHPATRHGVAHEKVRPLSNVVESRIIPVPVEVIPDDVAGIGEVAVRTAAVTPVKAVKPEPEPVPEERATDRIPESGTEIPAPAPTTRVIIPQIIEELLPAQTGANPLVEQERAPLADHDHETWSQSFRTTVRSLTITEEASSQPSQIPEAVTAEAAPVVETAPEDASAVPPPAAAGLREIPDIIRALGTGSGEMVTTDPVPSTRPVPEPAPDSEDAGIHGIAKPQVTEPVTTDPVPSTPPVPEPAPDSEDAGIHGIAEPQVTEPVTTDPVPSTPPVPEPAPDSEDAGIHGIAKPQVAEPVTEKKVEESVDLPALEGAVREEAPAAAEAPRIRHPIPPAREIRPLKTTMAYAVVLLLLVALVAAAVLLLPAGFGNSGSRAIPAPQTIPVTTLPPVTMLPATILPVTTFMAPPVPSLPASPVYQTGVWVRVNSTAYYIGTAGNPERVRPVSGTGENFYKVLRSDRPVQVSVQKQDNSGAVLAVAIYRNGTLISSRSVTSPMGSVDLLIDPQTGRAPGLSENDTHAGNAAMPVGRLENY